MSDTSEDELLINSINDLTQKMSGLLLKEFLKLPKDMQKTIVLIKSTQLLLANILCQVALNKEELDKISHSQGHEIIELTENCAMSGYVEKFSLRKH